MRSGCCSALVLLLLACSGEPAPAPRQVVTDFYAALRSTGTTGAPTRAQLASLAPHLSAELQSLLESARALHDADFASAPDEKPRFVEGDLFTSLFEGHTALEILSDSARGDFHVVTVRFTNDKSPPPTSWTDRVILREENGRRVIADVEYGGDWPFANRGTLVTSLRASGVGVARQNGLQLVLTLTAGTVTLTDDTATGDAYVRHRYVGRAEGLPFHLVHLSLIEGQSYLLVHDSTGRKVAIDAPPVASPDGARFTTASVDLVAGYDPNRLVIWRVAGDTAHQEFSVEPGTWGPADARWRGTDSVTFTARFATDDPGTVREEPGLVVRHGDRWELRRP